RYRPAATVPETHGKARNVAHRSANIERHDPQARILDAGLVPFRLLKGGGRRANTPRRSPVRLHFIFSALTCVSILNHQAVFAGPINGRVIDPDQRPVPSARVLLVAAGAPIRSAKTDSRGEFTLLAPDEGRYELRVAADGFRADPIAYEASGAPRDIGSI